MVHARISMAAWQRLTLGSCSTRSQCAARPPAHSTITCAVEPHRNGWAVRIQDQGPGIRRDRQAAIFQPFERGEGGHGRAPGAGLGLAFVKTVATRHGGQVLLHSGDEGGCTFWLVLPKRAAAEA